MSTNQESIASFYSPKFEQQCYLCQHGLHGVEQQNHSTGIIVGEPVVVYQTPEVIVSQTIGQPIPVKRGITQTNQINIQSTTPQREIQQTSQIQNSPTLIQTQQIQYNQLKPNEYETKQTYQIPIEQKNIHQAELKNSQQISTFYSGKYEQQCYLCQHGLHGQEVATTTQNNVVYQTPEVIVSQTFGQHIPVKRGITQTNQINIQSTTPQREIQQTSQIQNSPTLIQTQQIQYNQLKPNEYETKQTYQIPIEQKNIHQAELKNSQQISTFYSGKYEQQCYLCQHGLHGQEVATTTQNNVVYQTPEVIVSQTIGQPLTTRNTTTVQNFSQIINTPPKNDFVYSQQILQQSPIQNIQLNVPQNQQIISTTAQQQQQLLQQSQIQNVQLNVPQNQQITTSQYQLQQSPIQNIQLNIPQNQQIISTTAQQQQQSRVQNIQLNNQQTQIIQQNQVVQQIPQIQNYQVTTVPQKIIQENVTIVQEQQMTPQEQVEMYWRYKVYELQERVYELMNQISLQKQGNTQHQRTGSQVKKSTEDSFKVEQAKQEILQLESQLKVKQKTSIDLRNKLNIMIYRQDPTDEATKYKEQELQQLRQKYNTLNFKHQSNVEDIAMTQAIIEAVKSGKGYKLVSVREQQQTSSYNKQSQGQQQYNQII